MNEDEPQEDQQQQPDLGYFSILNLNFFATDEDIKRFFNFLFLLRLLNFLKETIQNCVPCILKTIMEFLR